MASAAKKISKSNLEEIISSIENMKESNASYIESVKKTVNSKTFFMANEAGYIQKSDYLEAIENMEGYEIRSLELFFKHISQETKLNISPFKNKRKNSESFYYWITLTSKTVSSGYSLPVFPGIDKLIKDYTESMYNFELDFTQLYNEAKSN